ncbi:putative immunoglobulin-like, oberon, PHD finger domain-containing protein [Lupinus albus]|uniref:Putative immunoglobulin-like, oberon, PHD finger domain-containing protein n=1 Tax=Lupinus albus TaxID=3870 RepID=A0A6A4PJH0_LUPAL|nr:putative immunoglobulin-like, oberon, PHD finger domain-containing protein [Lupinus albus]
MAADLSCEGVALDPSKCSMLSMDEKRELVYEISKSHGASEMLQSWSRQEILQILCAEMGKERKYTGLTKLKIIEHLLKIVSEKKSEGHGTDSELHSSAAHGQQCAKRQRKIENPSRLPVPANNISAINDGDMGIASYCKNSACKAILNQADVFCKRCSCCICHQYDDNKDPSLWLICSSESPFPGVSCGLSCHLECALKHNGSGIGKISERLKLDGGFYCVSCGKVNDLLGCWRKQLMVAKDTRRVDILCYRVSLSQRLLQGTEIYQELHEIVDEVVKKLEPEVGPLTGSPAKIGRGIVNRLSSGPEVQKLCGLAVESLDSLLSKRILPSPPAPTIQGANMLGPNMLRFEDVTATSLTVILGSEGPSRENIAGYTLWHRKVDDVDYPVEPTCTSLLPNRRFSIKGLTPAREYIFKVVSNDLRELGMCEVHISTEHGEDEVPICSATERSQSPATNCSSLSNPSSVEDETNNSNPYSDQTGNQANHYHTFYKDSGQLASGNLSNDAMNCSNNIVGVGPPTDADSLSDKQHAAGTAGSIPAPDVLKLENKHSREEQVTEDMSIDDGLNSPIQTGKECVPLVGTSEGGLPNTPCKLEILKDGPGRNGRSKSGGKDLENGSGKREGPQDGSTSKKGSGERQDEGCTDRDFEYYVKVIRYLECEGHIEKNFRQKFLTWYSLRATSQEVRIVKIYIDTFLEDPASLAEQLVDTFSECISSKKTSMVKAGFCMKLWH